MKPGVDYIGVSVAFICHDGSGNILMAKRSKNTRDEHGTWECGGGRLELGENPRDGVLREVREEYCCEGAIEQELPYISIVRNFNGIQTHWVTIPFIIRISREDVKIGEPKFIDEIGWFRMDNFPQPLHQGYHVFLKERGDALRNYFSKFEER